MFALVWRGTVTAFCLGICFATFGFSCYAVLGNTVMHFFYLPPPPPHTHTPQLLFVVRGDENRSTWVWLQRLVLSKWGPVDSTCKITYFIYIYTMLSLFFKTVDEPVWADLVVRSDSGSILCFLFRWEVVVYGCLSSDCTHSLMNWKNVQMADSGWLKCCFRSTETVGSLGIGAQDGHLHFHTAPEVWLTLLPILL